MHELRSLAKPSEPDVFSRDAKLCAAKSALAFLDRFPALFDGRQIPAFALPAHHPQASLRGVKCQPASDGEVLDRFVGSELRVAEEAC